MPTSLGVADVTVKHRHSEHDDTMFQKTLVQLNLNRNFVIVK